MREISETGLGKSDVIFHGQAQRCGVSQQEGQGVECPLGSTVPLQRASPSPGDSWSCCTVDKNWGRDEGYMRTRKDEAS